MSLHPTSRFVASGSGDATVILWDLVSGKPVHTLTGHTAGVSAVAIDENYLVRKLGLGLQPSLHSSLH